eukprot:1535024-Amphidinium_carterae.1
MLETYSHMLSVTVIERAHHPDVLEVDTQKILNWVRDATKRISTWHLLAPRWFEGTVKEAKRLHLKYVTSSPRDQCAIEKKFILGRSAPIPVAEHALESDARCEILDAIPEWLKSQINTAGMHSTKDVMWFILKVLQPSPDYLRNGISRDLMAKATKIKTYARAIQWLEIFHAKLEVAIDVDVRVEPQEVLHHLVQTVQQVCYNDMKTSLLWTRLTDNDHSMTSSFSFTDVLDLTREFTVELRLLVTRKRQTAAVHRIPCSQLLSKMRSRKRGMKKILQHVAWGTLLRKEIPRRMPHLNDPLKCARHTIATKDAQMVVAVTW